MAIELTKNPVNITAANAPAGTKVYTFTRGEKFFLPVLGVAAFRISPRSRRWGVLSPATPARLQRL
jgi:hypothetical protein